MEEWKPIKDFPEYEVSNLGRVKSLNYNHTKKENILKHGVCSRGYPRVVLSYNNKKRYVQVHRLVAETFLPRPDNSTQVDHIDRNPLNNNLSNLRWVSCQENLLNRNNFFRGTNTGEPYISFKKRDNLYSFAKTINHQYLSKHFKTLEEAIKYRDSILNQTSLPT